MPYWLWQFTQALKNKGFTVAEKEGVDELQEGVYEVFESSAFFFLQELTVIEMRKTNKLILITIFILI